MISKIVLPITMVICLTTLCFGHTATRGVSTTTDLVVASTTSMNLLATTFTLTNHKHHCTVITSSQAENPANGTVDNRYIFNINLDGLAYGGSSRTIEFDDNAGVDDVGTTDVSSVYTYMDLAPGTYTVAWQAAKETEADADMTVSDSSMTIICTKAKLQ